MTAPFRHRRLGYLALQVPDLDRSTRFVTEVFGLDLVGGVAGQDGRKGRFFRVGPAHHDVLIEQGPRTALIRSSWELEREADVDIAFEHFQSKGMSPAWVNSEECARLSLNRAFRVVDPVVGAVWEYYAEMTYLSAPTVNTLTKFQGGKHFGMTVPDGKAIAEFATKELGFLMSDYFEGHALSLMRAWPNPNHHSVAFVQTSSPAPRLHHIACMVQSIDDIGRLFNRVKRMGVQVQWGMGRHPTSGSIHLYIFDHDYIVWEYTFGMEQFPAENARPPRRFSLDPEEFDLWGAEPDMSHGPDMPAVLTTKHESRLAAAA